MMTRIVFGEVEKGEWRKNGDPRNDVFGVQLIVVKV